MFFSVKIGLFTSSSFERSKRSKIFQKQTPTVVNINAVICWGTKFSPVPSSQAPNEGAPGLKFGFLDLPAAFVVREVSEKRRCGSRTLQNGELSWDSYWYMAWWRFITPPFKRQVTPRVTSFFAAPIQWSYNQPTEILWGRSFNIALLGGGQHEENTVVLHPSKTNGLNHL